MTPDPKTIERLSAYLDDVLPVKDRAAVESLLAGDADARKALKELKALRTGLKDLPASKPPESFYARVWRDVEVAPVHRPFLSHFPIKTVGVLATLALVIVATHDFRHPRNIGGIARSPLRMVQSAFKAGREPSPGMGFAQKSIAKYSEPAGKEQSLNAPFPSARLMSEAKEEESPLAKRDGESPTREKNLPLAAPASIAGGAAANNLPIFSQLRGEAPGVAAFQTTVVRSDSEWQELWPKLGTNRPTPHFDFSRVMVVGVFLGEKPTGGYSVQIQKALRETDGVRILHHVVEPPKGNPRAQVLTHPFHLVVIPRVEGKIDFESN